MSEIQTFCDEGDVECKKILQHVTMRFHSLLPVINWILEMFEPLKKYFVNQPKCKKMALKAFAKDSSKFCLQFIQNQLEIFNQSIQRKERQKTSAFEAFSELQLLKTKLANRKTLKFIPTKTKK